MANTYRKEKNEETAAKQIPWWMHLYGEVTGSLLPLRTRLKDVKFSPFVVPLPNAHMESMTYIEQLERTIPPVCGHFKFVERRKIPNITVDISDISAIGAGKGIDPFVNDYSGQVYANLDDFAKDGCQTQIDEASSAHGMTPQAVESLLDYYEVRITNDPQSDSLMKIPWAGRVALSNSGGSHHFSAARYIAKNIGYRRSISGDSYELYIDCEELNEFLKNYIMLIVNRKDIPLTSSNDSIFGVLQKICRDNQGRPLVYYTELCDEPFSGFAVLVFERNNKFEKITKMLTGCGAFDVGEYIVGLST